MLKRRLTAVLVTCAASLVVAQAATAQKPYREPLETGPGVLDACGYDIGIEPGGGKEFLTIYDSGRLTIHARLRPTLTNVETGFTKVFRLSYLFSETFDEDANQIEGQITGRSLFAILPGDVGLSGEPDPDGGLIYVVGRLTYAMDPETGAITSLNVSGTVTDICAVMAS